MRLTCPNCTAQYQVPADAIPENGRDVQCSACDHTWFQSGTIDTAAAAPTAPITAPPVRDKNADDTPASAPDTSTDAPTTAAQSDDLDFERQLTESLGRSDPAHTSEQDTIPEPAPETDIAPDTKTQDTGDDATTVKPKLPKRKLDPQVANVLREEAEREKRARLAAQEQDQDTETGQAIPDVAEQTPQSDAQTQTAQDAEELDEIVISPEPKRKKIYPPNLDDLDDLYNQTADTADQVQGDTLPDPDDLKSSLQDDGDDVTILGAPDTSEEPKEKSNRRSGFILAFIVLAAGFWLYSNAAAVAEAIPQTKMALQVFVLSVDTIRDGLNVFAASIVTLVSGWLA